MKRSALVALICAFSFSAHALADDLKPVTVPPGDLASALESLGRQFGIDVIYPSQHIRGLKTPGLSGTLDVRSAFTKLLEGTELTVKTDASGAVLIALPHAEGNTNNPGGSESSSADQAKEATDGAARAIGGTNGDVHFAQAEPAPSPAASQRSPDRSARTQNNDTVELGELVVTGTNIEGVRPASPVVTITREEMRLAGHNNLGEVARALPQNFNGGQNPGVTLAANVGGNFANANVTGASSFNLRGLGPDATLTLLNGTRFAYDGLSQAVDVSAIPVAAIERIEVLLDGASAIYGSDAVGGVANIVLKRDYDGAEVSARYGGATDGGYEQQQYAAVAGTQWDSGGFLIAGDYSYNDSVRAEDRDYLSQLADQNVTIYPQLTQESALFSGHQQLGAWAELLLDAFYTERSQEIREKTSAASFFVAGVDSSIWGVAPSLDFALPGEWSARVHGAASRNEAESTSTGFSVATGAQTTKSRAPYRNEMQTADIGAEGPLFALPGGHARLSIGGGYRRDTFERTITNLVTGVVGQSVAGEESSRYVYGEVDLPLMKRLSMNAAVRHEDYDSFDAATTPKIGIIWGLAPGFDLKASWGRSYKIPTQFQQHRAVDLILEASASYGMPAGSQVLRLAGGNPDLDPEEAEIITAGFVARPEFLPGLTLELGYFDIDYTDRVAFPIDVTTQALSNPVFAEFVTRDPTTEQQNAAFAEAGLPVGTPRLNSSGAPYDPALVIALVDNVYTNVSTHRVKGFDLIARYTMDLLGGDLSLSGNGDWITEGIRKLTELAPELPAAGVNYWPAKFRGRFGASWSRQGLSLSANLNYTDGIIDRSVTPNVKRDSMTTMDLIADYQWDSDLVGDVGFNLAVSNVFNEEPPFLQPPIFPAFVVSYDSNNYSALGRVVSATITKRFGGAP